MTNEIIRVLIADDHSLIRAGLRVTLEDAPGIQVVGEAKNGTEVQHLVTELCPNLLVLDLPMPGTHPAEVAAWVREHYPDTIILVLAEYDYDVYLSHMIEAGVTGYILKSDADGAVIVDAILRAVQGESLVTKDQIARATAWHKKVGERWQSLTKRERQVVRLLAKGLSNTSIADSLGIKKETVTFHVRNVIKKLKVSSRLEAAVWVYKHLPEDLRGNL